MIAANFLQEEIWSEKDNGQGKGWTKVKIRSRSTKINLIKGFDSAEEKCSPRAFTHISTGVVYASPGVVKIPPCVLHRVRMAYSTRVYWHAKTRTGYGLSEYSQDLSSHRRLINHCHVGRHVYYPELAKMTRGEQKKSAYVDRPMTEHAGLRTAPSLINTLPISSRLLRTYECEGLTGTQKALCRNPPPLRQPAPNFRLLSSPVADLSRVQGREIRLDHFLRSRA